jgi:hypothetical protein
MVNHVRTLVSYSLVSAVIWVLERRSRVAEAPEPSPARVGAVT